MIMEELKVQPSVPHTAEIRTVTILTKWVIQEALTAQPYLCHHTASPMFCGIFL